MPDVFFRFCCFWFLIYIYVVYIYLCFTYFVFIIVADPVGCQYDQLRTDQLPLESLVATKADKG
jgi:hypothetical protein